MTLQPNRIYNLEDIEPELTPYEAAHGHYCFHRRENREAAEGSLFGRAYLVDRCTDCGKEWPVRPLTARRRAQLRTAQARVSQ